MKLACLALLICRLGFSSENINLPHIQDQSIDLLTLRYDVSKQPPEIGFTLYLSDTNYLNIQKTNFVAIIADGSKIFVRGTVGKFESTKTPGVSGETYTNRLTDEQLLKITGAKKLSIQVSGINGKRTFPLEIPQDASLLLFGTKFLADSIALNTNPPFGQAAPRFVEAPPLNDLYTLSVVSFKIVEKNSASWVFSYRFTIANQTARPVLARPTVQALDSQGFALDNHYEVIRLKANETITYTGIDYINPPIGPSVRKFIVIPHAYDE